MQGVSRSGVLSQKIRRLSEYSILLAHRPDLIGWLPEPEAWLTFLAIKLTGNWDIAILPGNVFPCFKHPAILVRRTLRTIHKRFKLQIYLHYGWEVD